MGQSPAFTSSLCQSAGARASRCPARFGFPGSQWARVPAAAEMLARRGWDYQAQGPATLRLG